jgi:NAD-dependent deacetylase
MATDDERRLAQALQQSTGLVLVVTGAGVSSASGIPTFRGAEPDAVWKVSDVELATWAFFRRDPVEQWRWYLERFRHVDIARPNPAHRALVDLERWQTARGGRFLLVTQNIDTLHETAGSRELIKVHGSSDRLRCTRAGCPNSAPAGSVARADFDLQPFRAAPSREALPRCPACGDLLRAHVLFFDEYYQEHRDYRFEEVLEGARDAELVLFVGTSFSVGITDLCLQAAARQGTPMYAIDPAGARVGRFPGLGSIAAPAEEILPRVVAHLESAPHPAPGSTGPVSR